MITTRKHKAALAAGDAVIAAERRLAAHGWNLYDKTLANLSLALARVQELEDQQNAALDVINEAQSKGATVVGIRKMQFLLGYVDPWVEMDGAS